MKGTIGRESSPEKLRGCRNVCRGVKARILKMFSRIFILQGECILNYLEPMLKKKKKKKVRASSLQTPVLFQLEVKDDAG